MAIKLIRTTVKGIQPLLFNNPQTVDPMNKFSKAKKKITSKRVKTDEDVAQLRDLEMESKIYFENGEVVIPTTWLTAAIHSISFKKAKIAKKDSRSALFTVSPTVPLRFNGMRKVKTIEDVVRNHDFRHTMNLKQGQVKITKVAPIFHEWEFSIDLEYDDEVYDEDVLSDLIKHATKYGGFGDFRPTFGRGTAEVEHVTY